MPRIRAPERSACLSHERCDGSCGDAGASTSVAAITSDDIKRVSNRRKCLDCKEKQPTYGSEKGKPLYCSPCARKQPGKVYYDVVNPRCKDCGEKKPYFGSEPGKAIYCAACSRKRPDEKLRDVINARCEDCREKNPVFGSESGKRRFCAECAHKRPGEGLYDVAAKRCNDCKTTRANFGTEPGKALYCGKCSRKRPNEKLYDVVAKRCEDCREKQPVFGSEPGKRRFCAECARKRPNENLYDIVNPQCEDCRKKNPVFGSAPGKRQFCADCARKRPSEGLFNTVNKQCLTLHCTTTASNKAYLGHCMRCFVHTYPDNQIVRNHKTKERAVADYVRSEYPDFTIAFDQRVADGCSRRRPDILMDLGEYVIITEIDENQHEAYNSTCENKRLMQLFTDVGSRPLVMIRFNPDQYYDKNQKSVASCWGHTKDKGLCVVKPNKKDEWAVRLATLKTTLDLVIAQGTTKEVNEILLYYDGF